jgi:hypothetical protein
MVLVELHPAIHCHKRFRQLIIEKGEKSTRLNTTCTLRKHTNPKLGLFWWRASLRISITLRWGQTPFFSSQSLEWVSAKMGSCWSGSHILVPKGNRTLFSNFLFFKGMEHQSGLENMTTSCLEEHLINLTTAHHWTRAPLWHHGSCCLLTFLYLVNPFLHIPGYWLVESHNSHSLYVP